MNERLSFALEREALCATSFWTDGFGIRRHVTTYDSVRYRNESGRRPNVASPSHPCRQHTPVEPNRRNPICDERGAPRRVLRLCNEKRLRFSNCADDTEKPRHIPAMNRTAAWLRPEDIPSSLRLLSVMEEFGEISAAEASEWRSIPGSKERVPR